MAAFDLGLALISIVIVWSLQAYQLARSDVPFPKWPLSLLAGLAMLIGGHVTSRFEPPTESVARRFIRRTLVPPLVACLVVAVPLALLFGVTGGANSLLEVFALLALGLLAGVGHFGLPALVVTTLWALLYVIVERRLVTRS